MDRKAQAFRRKVWFTGACLGGVEITLRYSSSTCLCEWTKYYDDVATVEAASCVDASRLLRGHRSILEKILK